MKVFAIKVDLEELQKSKGSALKNFPIPMPKDELETLTKYCQERGWNRCEWARRVLRASLQASLEEERKRESA
jgi:hypothetical protein